jgi:hypothetical protein
LQQQAGVTSTPPEMRVEAPPSTRLVEPVEDSVRVLAMAQRETNTTLAAMLGERLYPRESGNGFGRSLAGAMAKPPEFHGGHGEKIPIRDWLDTMASFITTLSYAHNWPSDAGMHVAVGYLRGDAQRFWKDTNARFKATHPGHMPDWNCFKREMCTRFERADPVLVARKKLDMLSMKECYNDVQAYTTKFETLCASIEGMAEGEKVHRYISGLSPNFAACVAVDPMTKQRWLEYTPLAKFALAHGANHQLPPVVTLRELEANKAGTNTRRNNHAKPSPSEREGKGKGKRVHGTLSATSARKRVRRSEEVKEFCKSKHLCFNCFNSGHQTRDCKAEAAEGVPNGFKS